MPIDGSGEVQVDDSTKLLGCTAQHTVGWSKSHSLLAIEDGLRDADEMAVC